MCMYINQKYVLKTSLNQYVKIEVTHAAYSENTIFYTQMTGIC